MIVIHFGLFGFLDEFVRSNSTHYIISGLLFFGILFLINDILNIPFSLYSTFVVEEKYGFNKTSIHTFIADKCKGYGLTIVFGSAIMVPVFYFFNTFQDNGWWIAWALITAFMIAVQPLFVHVIAPMFNKFTPLEEGDLKTAIEEFANKVSFPIGRIDVMDGSKRSAHSNAYFSGFGKSRRIALFDTLLDKHSTEEIVSVVAHEIGHYKKKHIITGTVLGVIETGIMLFIFNLFMNDSDLFAVFSVDTVSIYCGLVFFSMLYSPISMVTSIFTTAMSRKNEFEADNYAKETYNGDSLVLALKKLYVDSLSNIYPHPLYVFFHYSHPPLLERIKNIEGN